MGIVIEALRDPPVASRGTELVERKGVGHPDTVCDCLVEAVSLALNRRMAAFRAELARGDHAVC